MAREIKELRAAIAKENELENSFYGSAQQQQQNEF